MTEQKKETWGGRGCKWVMRKMFSLHWSGNTQAVNQLALLKIADGGRAVL